MFGGPTKVGNGSSPGALTPLLAGNEFRTAIASRVVAGQLAPSLRWHVLFNDSRDLLVRLSAVLSEHICLIGRILCRCQLSPRLIPRLDVDYHRQPDAQGVLIEFLLVERDAHGQTLHHLDPV